MVDILQMTPQSMSGSSRPACPTDAEVRMFARGAPGGVDDEAAAGQEFTAGLGEARIRLGNGEVSRKQQRRRSKDDYPKNADCSTHRSPPLESRRFHWYALNEQRRSSRERATGPGTVPSTLRSWPAPPPRGHRWRRPSLLQSPPPQRRESS